MDYFDVLLEANVESLESAPIRIHARGLIWGRELCLRRANFADDTRDLFDSALQLRLSYVYTTDMDFGGGAVAD